MSDKSRRAIASLLARHYSDVTIRLIDNFDDLCQLALRKPDFVFLGLKYVPTGRFSALGKNKKQWVGQFLDDNQIAYSGSNFTAHKLELNKSLAKKMVASQGLATASYYQSTDHKTMASSDLEMDFPVFVKPTDRGGGLGIDDKSVAHNFSQALAKVKSIKDVYGSESLIEQYLPGREFSVAILKDDITGFYDVMPMEIECQSNLNGHKILGSATKKLDKEKTTLVTDKKLASKINQLALDCFLALGANDYGRIDIRLDANSKPHFLEANLIPSLIEDYGNFPKSCLLNKAKSYEDIILQIVNLGMMRASKCEPIVKPALEALLGPLASPLFEVAV